MNKTNKIIMIQPTGSGNFDLKSLLPANVDWDLLKELNERLIYPTVRIGKNTLPYKNTLVDVLHDHAPEYQPGFNETFSQVTDKRYHELKSRLNDRPWVILWSGGIDSTVMVTSILRNASAPDRQNIFIACNESSIYENPKFFMDHILPNFSIIDADNFELSEKNLKKYYVLNGGPADALYCQFFGIIQALDLRNPGLINLPIHNHAGHIIDIMHKNLGVSHKFAEWWHSFTVENINSQSVPVETIHDFFWWNSFNFNWTGTIFRDFKVLRFFKNLSKTHIDLFWSNYIGWYDSADYQLWAMHNNKAGITFGQGPSEFKLVAKQYIHSYDHDEYYLRFKCKARSKDLFHTDASTHKIHNWRWDFFCMLDDFTPLTLSRDLEQIQSLLPDFFNTQK
jgi:hypothetical protein